MNIVVLGSGGYVGRATLATLAGRHTIRAFDLGDCAWSIWNRIDGEWTGGEKVYGDISNMDHVAQAVRGMDGVIHISSVVPESDQNTDVARMFNVNIVGLWNTLEASRLAGVKRVVHIGSCHVDHADGIFFESNVPRYDATAYAMTKRLQEEMCRHFHGVNKLPIIVLRPSSIIDSRLGLYRSGEPLPAGPHPDWLQMVCRHDLASAARLAVESDIPFDIFHVAGFPEAGKTCNRDRAMKALSLKYQGNLERWRGE